MTFPYGKLYFIVWVSKLQTKTKYTVTEVS